MRNQTLIVRRKDCIGCHACEVACKQEHSLPVGVHYIKVIERIPHFLPLFCHHCYSAPCMKVCPTDAIYKEDAVILLDGEKCIGCKECLEACPFGAMGFWPEEGVAVKCNLCFERIKEGKGPACAEVCPTRCVLFGEMKDVMGKLIDEQSRG